MTKRSTLLPSFSGANRLEEAFIQPIIERLFEIMQREAFFMGGKGGVLNEQAAKLREVAAALEARGADLPRSAESAVQRFAAAEQHTYAQRITLEYANKPDFVEHCVKQAGLKLGLAIGEKLRAAFKGFRMPDWNDPYSTLARERCAEYEAKVYVFTPDALKAYTQRVIEAEREKIFPVGPRPWVLT